MNNKYDKISNIHSYTADNPNAYFDGTKWVRVGKDNNKRYKKAITKTKKYLKEFINYVNETKGKDAKKYVKKLNL